MIGENVCAGNCTAGAVTKHCILGDKSGSIYSLVVWRSFATVCTAYLPDRRKSRKFSRSLIHMERRELHWPQTSSGLQMCHAKTSHRNGRCRQSSSSTSSNGHQSLSCTSLVPFQTGKPVMTVMSSTTFLIPR